MSFAPGFVQNLNDVSTIIADGDQNNSTDDKENNIFMKPLLPKGKEDDKVRSTITSVNDLRRAQTQLVSTEELLLSEIAKKRELKMKEKLRNQRFYSKVQQTV